MKTPLPTQKRRITLSQICLVIFMLVPLIMVISARAQEEAVQVDVTAGDRVAASYGVSNFAYHIFPANTPTGRAALAVHNLGTAGKISNARTVAVAASVPAVPSPGFYGEDLVYFGGKVLKTTTSHSVYVNMNSCGTVATCWGNPEAFLSDLSNSDFIHLTDQYVSTASQNRYPVGKSSKATIPLFVSNVVSQADIFAVIHAAAKVHGTGYGHIYHVFLPKGEDTCFDLTSICYSPDNPPSFFFCAYHGSLDYTDIGHVLMSVEPYQKVPGCEEGRPNPNGMRADSTNSTLSHEQIESITDPDPFGPGDNRTGWVSFNSSIVAGAEIGDLCVSLSNGPPNFEGLDPTVILNGHPYQLQGEYSNHYHACAFTP
jgi:hypothetical protein